jgi:hypothetical protein
LPTPGLQIAASQKKNERLRKGAEEWQSEEATVVLTLYHTLLRVRERERERVQWPTLIRFAELSCWGQPQSSVMINIGPSEKERLRGSTPGRPRCHLSHLLFLQTIYSALNGK